MAAWWIVGTQMLAASAGRLRVVEARVPKCEGPGAPASVGRDGFGAVSAPSTADPSLCSG